MLGRGASSIGRGVQRDALANSGTANNYSSQYNKAGQDTLNTLAPTLTNEATNPEGFTSGDMNNINTAALQSLGGGQAASVGQAGLKAARTRNAGAGDAAIAESAREGMRDQSQRAAEAQIANAKLRESKRQAALGQLQGLYNTNVGSSLQALGLSNQSLGIASNAKNGVLDTFGNAFATDLAKALTTPPVPMAG